MAAGFNQGLTHKVRALERGRWRSERDEQIQCRAVHFRGRRRRFLGDNAIRLRPRPVDLDDIAHRQPALDRRDLRAACARTQYVRYLHLRLPEAHQHVDMLARLDAGPWRSPGRCG